MLGTVRAGLVSAGQIGSLTPRAPHSWFIRP